MSTRLSSTMLTTTNGSPSKETKALVVRPRSAGSEQANPTTNSSQGRPQAGQVISLKPNTKISINEIAQRMVRPVEHVEAIKNSIADVGQLTPCVVVQLPDGNFQLIAGVTRKTACDQLQMPCKCIVIATMTEAEANDWVAREREANRNQRHLNAAQKAIDAARICRDVFEPAAAIRMKAGKEAKGESGESTKLAAEACGVTASSVKSAKKILDTPAELLVKAGLLTSLALAQKVAQLSMEKLSVAEKLCHEQRIDALRRYVDEEPKQRKDKLGQEIPSGSPLTQVFENAKAFDKQIAVLESVREFVLRQLELDDDNRELRQIQLDVITKVAQQIADARPHAMCPVCLTHGKDPECNWCAGRRWLTTKRYGQFETAQREAMKQTRPR